MPTAYEQLKTRYESAHILNTIQAILLWDERVMMPPASGAERTGMRRVINETIRNHYMLSSEVKDLLQDAQHEMHTLSEWDKRNLQHMINAYDDPPLDIVPNLRTDLRNAESLCRQVWPVARTNNNWDAMAAPFGQMVYYRRLLNTAIAAVREEPAPYDVSLSMYSRKIRTRLFDQISDTLIPHLKEFLQTHGKPVATTPDVAPLAIPPHIQLTVMQRVIADMGFDFSQGRLDTAMKAFFENTDHDRRIVTTVNPGNFMNGMSSTVHEAGHALHYQYLPKDWITQPVGKAGDFCMREAVAFIWQIFVAQTKEFHIYLAKHLQDIAGMRVDPIALFNAQNTIRPSFLRIGSDPATYALHIMIRYRIERDLVNGTQDVKTLPQRWADEYREALNVEVPDNTYGVLQDIHWYKGSFGYFPCYLLALLYAAQLFQKAQQDIPNLVAGFATGNFAPLVQWLRDKIYSQANFYDGLTLLENATGEPLNPVHFMDYLKNRYQVTT
ncbi:MAG TPA: hypothetical protein VGF14_00540 [Alphaproteobacteria bacterium]